MTARPGANQSSSASSPAAPPATPAGLSSTLARNIAALQARRREEAAEATFQEHLAQRITAFSGSMAFVYLHLAVVVAWVACNLGWIPGAPKFDASFVILATAASVEAIFLSTFVLISQNRAMAAADRRADLDLQINLLAEHEVTRLIALTAAIAEKLGVEEARSGEFEELKQDIAPEAVLDTLEHEDESAR